MTHRKFFSCALAFAVLSPLLSAASVTPLHLGWTLQSACRLSASGQTISSPGFSAAGWIHTSVPSTVLAAQVAAGIYPDPYFGDNLRKIPGETYPIGQNFSNIPMPADSPYHCGWWYRDDFVAPAAAERDGRYWLHFGGINYRADIWLNGKKIADSSQIAGAYRIYDLDVTVVLKPGAKNVLAVETFAPTPMDLGVNWVDWSPMPPDKDMGLWGAVDLESTGPVALRSPMVATHFDGDDLSVANLTVYALVENGSSSAQAAVVSGSASGATFEQTVQLAPHETKSVVFTPRQFPQLRIRNPQLWWPRQMGDPHLQPLTMSVRVGGRTTDTATIQFGIREITSELNGRGDRVFRINGRRLLIRGGGWSQDMMLRVNPERLRKQFRLVRGLNLNTIRLEGKLASNDFFRLADKNGILILAGWCCCDQWEHWKDWTPQVQAVATASLRSQMLRLRSHPSLLVWLNGSDNPPPAKVETAYLQVEAETHWPNPIVSSASGQRTTVTGVSGVKMTGPYNYVEPSYWYFDQQNGGDFGFNTETSPGPAIPSEASRRRFLPDPDAWPPSSDWSFHYGGGDFTNLSVFNDAMNAVYAKPASLAEYEQFAATMEYASERAMFESYTGNKYVSTGVIQWMLNNAWPSMIWHLYDYNLEPDAGYYAVKKACEPLHIQYNYKTMAAVVVNSTYHSVDGLHASIDVHGIRWNLLYHADATLNLSSDSVQQVFDLPPALNNGTERIFLIDLRLTDSAGHLVSHNFYWVPYTLTRFDWAATYYTTTPAARYPDLTALTHLPPATVEAHAAIANAAHGREIRLQLRNTSGALAFQLSARVRTASGGLVAPVMWSDDWIELEPGESTTLTAELPADAPRNPVVVLRGWNIPSATLTPAAAAQ